MNDLLRKYQNMLINLTLNNRTIYLDKIHKGEYFDFYKIKSYNKDIYYRLINFIFSKDVVTKIVEDPLYWQIDKVESIKDKIIKEKEIKIKEFTPNDDFGDLDSYKDFLDKFYDDNSSKSLDLVNINYGFLHDIIEDLECITDGKAHYDSYIGYPFVEGYIDKDNFIRLPLFLIPIRIVKNDNEWFIEKKVHESIIVNKYIPILINSIFDVKGLDLTLEYCFNNFNIDVIHDLVSNLKSLGIKFKGNDEMNIRFNQFSSNDNLKYEDTYLRLKNYMVMGMFNNIPSEFSDYEYLIHSDLTHTLIDKVLTGENDKEVNRVNLNDVYVKDRVNFSEKKIISLSDYNDITVVNSNIHSDKRTTICNLIVDKLSKGNKVLVVSKSEDVLCDINNSFGNLKRFILNISKDDVKNRVIDQLDSILSLNIDGNIQDEFNSLILNISDQYDIIEDCNSIYNRIESFGLSLQEMYEFTMGISQDSIDSNFLDKFISNNPVSGCTFKEIVNALENIKSEDLVSVFISYMEYTIKFKALYTLKEDFRVEDRESYINKLKNIKDKYKKVSLNIEKNELSLKILDLFKQDNISKSEILHELRTLEGYDISNDGIQSWFKNFTFFKNKKEEKITEDLKDSPDISYYYNKIEELNNDISFLGNILKPDVFRNIRNRVLSFDDITDYIDNLYNMILSLDVFLSKKSKINGLNLIVRDILEFVYDNSITESMMRNNLDIILKFSIFTNIIRRHDKYGEELLGYRNVGLYFKELFELFDKREEKMEEFLFSICSKMAQEYILGNNRERVLRDGINQDHSVDLNDFMSRFYKECLVLFPCMLIKSDRISSTLPMICNMFDYIIFEDGEEYFIHDAIQHIYRGKRVVLFGDSSNIDVKAREYKIINSCEEHISYNLFSYLKERYTSFDLDYIYTNRNDILRDISECMFKDSNTIYMPSKRKYSDIINPFEILKITPIENDLSRINLEDFIVNLLFKTLKTKDKHQSIAIVTLTNDHKKSILKILDDRLKIDEEFSLLYYKECKKYGFDRGVYISSIGELEYNGRDILILSLGCEGDLESNINKEFEELGDIKGKNKLRILTKMTSSFVKIVSPYDLDKIKINSYTQPYASMFMKYLYYANEIYKGNVDIIMKDLCDGSLIVNKNSEIIDRVYGKLIERGLEVEKNFGTYAYKFDLAIYDRDFNRYILFVEFESSLIQKFSDVMERYVDCFVYFDTLGYNVLKIWSRDMWDDMDVQIENIVATYTSIKNRMIEMDSTGEYSGSFREEVLGKFVNLIEGRCNQLG